MNPTKNADTARTQEERQNLGALEDPIDPWSEPDWDTLPDLQEEEDRRELSTRWQQDMPDLDRERELRLRLWREGGGF